MSSMARFERKPTSRSMAMTVMYVDTLAKAAVASTPATCTPRSSQASLPPPKARPRRSLWQWGAAKIGTHRTPQAPGGPCAATAPTTSSSCMRLRRCWVRSARIAATTPIGIESHGGTTLQQPQLATMPATVIVANSGMVMTVERRRQSATGKEVTAAPAVMRSVVALARAATRSALSVVEKVDAGLKARNPTSSRKTPKRACTGLWMELTCWKTLLSTSVWGPR
mmetsp:Transcript_2727/g.8349  ORF Transcript_2727/g.8349 Transcript_2727/m.8349 type:complete len:225 (+) Transcript_2727:216-890(+)